MTNTLLEHFAKGTQKTVTGSKIGCEIETIFVFADTGMPVSLAVSQAVRGATEGRPTGCINKIELSRATHELAIGPCGSFEELLDLAHCSLAWQYQVADRYGAVPLFAPEIRWGGSLLDPSEDRDQLWLRLDGAVALEQLVCASVQFTVDVHPHDAIPIINELWRRRLHEVDFAPNHRRWQNYIALSNAGYDPLRYGGPAGFQEGVDDLADYVRQLSLHDVVMHGDQLVRLNAQCVPDLNIDLFLRSVWWHYRLRRPEIGPESNRRPGSTLAVEIRPIARRDDDCLERYWRLIAPVFGL